MSRSGYRDDCDMDFDWVRWRGTVARAIKGKRGQAFLSEMLAALDALPQKRLIKNALQIDGHCDLYDPLIVGADELVAKDGTVAAMGEVCAIGAVGKVRGVDMAKLDPEDADAVAGTFGISSALAREIVWMNDEAGFRETPEQRFQRMREWIECQIKTATA